MHRSTAWTTVGIALWWMCAASAGGAAPEPRAAAMLQIDLAERLSAGRLRVVNREVTAIQGTRGVHLSERQGTGIAWVEGSEFGQGTIELDVRGRDVFQHSFVGVAFHRRDDSTSNVGSTLRLARPQDPGSSTLSGRPRWMELSPSGRRDATRCRRAAPPARA